MTGAFGYTAYAAAKHALVGFSESLRYELTAQGIDVHLVCPSEFDSPLVDALEHSRTPENRAHVHTIPTISLDLVVSDTIRGVERGKFLIIPSPRARLALALARHLPGLARRLSDYRISTARKAPPALA